MDIILQECLGATEKHASLDRSTRCCDIITIVNYGPQGQAGVATSARASASTQKVQKTRALLGVLVALVT